MVFSSANCAESSAVRYAESDSPPRTPCAGPAASTPPALEVAVKDGRIKRGDLVLLEAMGGGFTWGAALVRW